MIELQQVQQDINNLPEEAQLLLMDFVSILKKRYPNSKQKPSQLPQPQTLTPEEWIKSFEEWTESHRSKNFPHLSDKDISRESMYGERG